jgi:uncharacterized protein
MSRPTALVTGASSGFGAEFARLLAHDGHDLVLAARSGARMLELGGELEERYGIVATVLPVDLAHPGAAAELADEVAGRGIEVDVLVNSAGFTLFGPMAEEDEQELLDLLRVNMETLTVLTRRVLPGMVERGRGTVINLSSNAAFQPGPSMAAYYASKAYVLQLSLALAEEVRGTGVTVTALCPGPTRTGFQARGDMEDSKLVAGRRLPDAAEVAEWGYEQAKRGRPMAVHTTRWQVAAFGTRFLPRSLAARLAMRAQARV